MGKALDILLKGSPSSEGEASPPKTKNNEDKSHKKALKEAFSDFSAAMSDKDEEKAMRAFKVFIKLAG